jgi:hypothetical protein
MFAADRKRLAWGAAGDHVHARVPCLEILVVNVAFDERPMANELVAAPLIESDGFASLVIVLQNGIMLEAGVRCGKGEAASAREKLDATRSAKWRDF